VDVWIFEMEKLKLELYLKKLEQNTNPSRYLHSFYNDSELRTHSLVSQLFSINTGGRGVEGVPNFVSIGILIFLLVRSPCKISLPYDNHLREKSNPRRRREREERNKPNLRTAQTPTALYQGGGA
jgi:hypothetical protein